MKKHIIFSLAAAIFFTGSAFAICDNEGDCTFSASIVNGSNKAISYEASSQMVMTQYGGTCTSGNCKGTLQPGQSVTISSNNAYNWPNYPGKEFPVFYSINGKERIVNCYKGDDSAPFEASTAYFPQGEGFKDNGSTPWLCTFLDQVNN